jgi:uncharacterized spore protein YtfJ
MANENFIEKLASGLGQTASVKNVFGEPIQVGDKKIIPVARISYGFGGGYGERIKTKGAGLQDAISAQQKNPSVEGGGGGGGLHARAKGVFEITPTETRFIPANATRQILIGIAIGFLLKSFFFKKMK